MMCYVNVITPGTMVTEISAAVMKNVELRLKTLRILYHSTSYSEYHDNLRKCNLSKVNPTKGRFLVNYTPRVQLPMDDITQHREGEVETVQPYWTKKIQCLNDALIAAKAEVKLHDSHSITFFVQM